MTDEVKRGPGRPPKAKPEVEAQQSGTPAVLKVRVLTYKLQTSQGRFLQNWEREIPEAEAMAFEASGDVELC